MYLEVPNSKADPRVRRYVTATRVVWATEGAAAPANMNALLTPGQGICTLLHKDEAPGLLLDFGRELHGGVYIKQAMTGDQRPVKVRIRFGESVSEAMGVTNNDHAIHDQVVEIPWYGVTEIGNTGFRFVRLDLVDEGRELAIEELTAVFLYHDLEYKGSFHCSDERLNTIWKTGAYTVQLCMQENLWDGIKRDRLVWIGDMHPETMVINTVFGHTNIVPNSLDYVRDHTPLPQWMNGISSYSIWWVLIQWDWFLYHGDKAYLERQRPYLLGLLGQLQAQVDENGSEKMGPHRFLDWPSSEDADAIHIGLHALLALAFQGGQSLCLALGETQMAAACADSAAKLAAHTPPANTSKQANALLALSGLAGAIETNQRVLAVDQLRGLSTFYGYYVLQARAKAGDYQGCLDIIRGFWGGMLDLGATTFWEDFNLDWTVNAAGIDAIVPAGKKDIHADFGDYCYKGLRHSLCHGWAAGPVAWLSQHVLGITPASPGFGSVRIEPHLGDLTFAEGAFPTPQGIIHVSHRKTADGKVESDIHLPSGMRLA